MAVAGDARARHRRVDQAAVPYRPNTRMGAQAAAIPPATPIRTDRPPRPQNDPAPLTRLGLGRAARRRVQAPASAPTPNRLTRGASGALPTTNHANPRASACPQSTPTPPRSGKNTTARPPDAQPTPRSTQPDTPKRPHRGTPGRLLQATRFGRGLSEELCRHERKRSLCLLPREAGLPPRSTAACWSVTRGLRPLELGSRPPRTPWIGGRWRAS